MIFNLYLTLFGLCLLTCLVTVWCQTQSILKPPYASISVSGQFKSCGELHERGYNQSGIYPIYPLGGSGKPKVVLCYMTDQYAGTVILYRYNGLQSFDQNYSTYAAGFGEVDKDYWLGLESIYTLAAKNRHTKLTIVLEDWVGNVAAMHYPYFNLSPATDDYRLDVSTGFYGPQTRFNHMFQVKGSPFQTKDHYNGDPSHCAYTIKAGWWFRTDICTNGLLTGKYYRSLFQTGYYNPNNPSQPKYDDGVFWRAWRGGRYSAKYVTMALSTM